MAFKMNGWNAGEGTGSGAAFKKAQADKKYMKIKRDLKPKTSEYEPQTETRKNINTDITPQTQLGKKFNKMKGVVMKGKQSAMKKDSLTGKMEAVSERATVKNFKKVKKDLVPKSRATNRKPQSQMTDAELAEAKGIKNPQSIKPTPTRRRYGDSPNNMAKKSAMKKNGKPTKKTIKGDKAMLNAALKSGVIPGFDTYKKGTKLSKTRDGKKIYDSDEIEKKPGENLRDYYDRVDKTNRKEYAKSFVEMMNKKKNKSPKTMKKGSAMDMKKKSAMAMKKKK